MFVDRDKHRDIETGILRALVRIFVSVQKKKEKKHLPWIGMILNDFLAIPYSNPNASFTSMPSASILNESWEHVLETASFRDEKKY